MILTLTGPTCGGKSTLEAELQRLGVGRAISHTTRSPRAGETCGENYHFINHTTFDAQDARGDFIEKVSIGSNRYAMSKQSLQSAALQGDVVIVVDPHGAGQIADYCNANGLRHLGMWVYCTPEAQAARWLSRIGEDMTATGVERERAYKAATERLGLMLGSEQGWIRQMEKRAGSVTHPRLYSFFINTTHQPASKIASQIFVYMRKVPSAEVV